jgi:hypothetical protein
MTVRFQAADLNAEIVAGVLRREPSIDFQTADEASLRRSPDPEVLAFAAQEDRILVTHDRRDAKLGLNISLRPLFSCAYASTRLLGTQVLIEPGSFCLWKRGRWRWEAIVNQAGVRPAFVHRCNHCA